MSRLLLPVYFYYYLWVLLHFLVIFMSIIVLFQLTFIFIYGTFSKKKFNFNRINGSQTNPLCEENSMRGQVFELVEWTLVPKNK